MSEFVDLGIPGFEQAVVIGRGGFAIVYRAYQPSFHRTVAIKLLNAGHLEERARARFERELQATGRLSQHPSIVSVYEAGFAADGRPYLVMEYMPDGTLADRIAREGRLPWSEGTSIGIRLSGALEAAHQLDILHRDVKPSNILMSPYGEAMLADFGIARVAGGPDTKSGEVTATLAHAPPEILNGDPASPTADVYSLASTVFTILAGRPAFVRHEEESGIAAILHRVFTQPIPDLRPAGVPDAVCTAIESGMAKDTSARPQTAAEFGGMLQQAQQQAGLTPTEMVIGPGRVIAAPPLAPAPTPPPPVPAPTVAPSVPVAAPPPAEPTWSAAGSNQAPPEPGGGRRLPVRLIAGIGAVAVVAGAFTVYAVTRNGESPPATTVTTPAAAPTAASSPTTVAATAVATTTGAVVPATPDTAPPAPTTAPAPASPVVATRELWSYQTGDLIRSSPVVVGGAVVFGSNDGNVYSLNAVTGEEIWRFPTGGVVRSSPAVSGDVIYAGSFDGNLYAIDALTGTELWRFATQDEILSSPTVGAGAVAFGSKDRNLYVLAAATGAELWRFEAEDRMSSSPHPAGGALYVGSRDGSLYALDAATGDLLWSFATRAPVFSSPTVAGGIVYVGTTSPDFYAIDASTGSEVWRFEALGVVRSSPVVSGGVVYVGSDDGNLYALDAATGSTKWTFTTAGGPGTGAVFSSPYVAANTVFFGSFDDHVYALNATTGEEIFRYQTGGDVYSSPVVRNQVLYVGSDDGKLYALELITGG